MRQSKQKDGQSWRTEHERRLVEGRRKTESRLQGISGFGFYSKSSAKTLKFWEQRKDINRFMSYWDFLITAAIDEK